MKKILIGALLAYLFFQIVIWANNFANDAFFGEFYDSDFEGSDFSIMHYVDEATEFLKSLFESKDDEENYIYR